MPPHLDADLRHVVRVCQLRCNEEPELVAVRYVCIAQSQQQLPTPLEDLCSIHAKKIPKYVFGESKSVGAELPWLYYRHLPRYRAVNA